ncbi:unnamed protein product [Rhizophagus irregularis]|nr:unnamed protein product [Rhizophagus irregularis]
MEIDDLETPTEQRSSTAQKKRSRDSGASTEKSSNKKAKKTGGKKVSSTPKKLIEELLTDNPDGGRGLEETSESATVFKRYKELKLEHGKDGSQALRSEKRFLKQNVLTKLCGKGWRDPKRVISFLIVWAKKK